MCWGRDEWVAGCGTSDLLAAIDDAIQDGVHVISASLGGSPQPTFASPFDLAFMSAGEQRCLQHTMLPDLGCHTASHWLLVPGW